MTDDTPRSLVEKLAGMRTDLVDLAFTLERSGRIDAADVAIAVSTSLGELCEEFAATVGPAGKIIAAKT